jgi:biotin transporter BioY
MISSLVRLLDRRPRLTATMVGIAGSLAGYLLCYLLGSILLSALLSQANQSELASALLGVTELPFLATTLLCGWPIFLVVGLVVGLPLNELRTHHRWPPKTMLLLDTAASAMLGALICGPWSAFALFAILAYGG